MSLGRIAAPAATRQHDAEDEAVRARIALARPTWVVRRGIAALALVLPVWAWWGHLPLLTIAAGAAYLALTEAEILLASRQTRVARFEALVVGFRCSYLVLTVVAIEANQAAPWLSAILIVLVLVNSAGTAGWRGLLLITLSASLAAIVAVDVAETGWSLLGVPPVTFNSEYVDRTRYLIAGVVLPLVSVLSFASSRAVVRVREHLERTVSDLRSAQEELETSRDDLERWNRRLNSEIDGKTSALEERNRYLSIINAVSFALAEPMDDAGALERAARLVARLLGVRAAQAYRRDPNTRETMHLFVTVAPEDIHAPRLPETLLRHVAESGHPVTSRPEQPEDPEPAVALPDLGEDYAVVPLVAKGRVLGAFALIGTGRIAWDDQQRHLLLLIGREMGVALENARLYRGAVEKAHREELVAEVARLLNGQTRGERPLHQALEFVADHVGASEAMLIRVGDEQECIEIQGSRESDGAAGGSRHVLRHLARSLPGLVVDRYDPLILGAGGEAPLSERMAAQGVATMAIAPVFATHSAFGRPTDQPGQPSEAITEQAMVGVLVLATPTGCSWDEASTDVLTRVVTALSRRMEADELLAIHQRRIRELSALAEIARTMQSGADVDRLLGGFAHALSSLLPYQHVYLALLDEFGEFRNIACFESRGRPFELPAFDEADRSHRWFSVRSPFTWRRGHEAPPNFVSREDHAALIVPMRPKGQVLGVVVVGLARQPADDQTNVVEQAVEQLALALDSASLYQQATARASHIQALSNLARIVASVVNLREAFAAFAEEVRWLIPFERAVMLLLNEDESAIEPYAIYPEEIAEGAPVWLANSAASIPVHAGSAVAVRADDPRYRHLDWSIFGDDVHEVAAVPVRQGPRTAAVFALVHSGDGGYANSDLDALEEVAGLLGVTIERLRLYERAEHSAKHDLMTGLPNYRFLQERLQELRPGISEAGESALLMVDMDNLKVFNDTLGHDAGDRAIQVVAREIRAACREDDFVARTGGDEFVIVMEDADVDAAIAVADRIHEALADAHLEVPAAPTRLAVSIGIAVAPDDTDSTHDLLHFADEAMYAAKFSGGQRTSLARTREEQVISRRLQTRSGRIVETMSRAAMSGATPGELAAVAFAQRWAGAVVIRLGYTGDIATQVRMLVTLDASSRQASPRNDRDRTTARYFLGRLRADWLATGEPAAMQGVSVLIPAMVDIAWAMIPRPEGAGEDALRALERVAEKYGADPEDAMWKIFAAVIEEDAAERRRKREAA